MKAAAVFVLGLLVALASGATLGQERSQQRIVGGSATTINQYPFGLALLYNQQTSSIYSQWCGGTILTSSVFLTAAHCVVNLNTGITHNPVWWRIRYGSTFANSGGTVIPISNIVTHNNYNYLSNNNDVAILRTNLAVTYGTGAQPASIAGTNYNLADNQAVWAIGWGDLWSNGPASETLQHVQVWVVNQDVCRQRYGSNSITDSMLCSGWLDVGGRDQCQGDSGGPLIHNNVVVGVCSWGAGCADAYFPGVNARISVLSSWIVSVANSNI